MAEQARRSSTESDVIDDQDETSPLADGEEYEDTPKKETSTLKNILFVALCLLAFTMLGAALYLEHREDSEKALQEQELQIPEECGESSSEARDLGCIFDVIIMGWVPWRCHDAELAAEFLARDEWAFYRAPNTTGPEIPISEILAGEWEEVYVDYKYHVVHCTYTWRKTQRAAMSGLVLDGYIADPHHTNHCEMMLLHEPLAENSAYIKYASCPWVHVDRGRFGWYRMREGKKTYRQP
ncbi:hypothetical protein Daus18300_009385 [Diaporthe australafricana]|uniref:Major facilitator superfamily transporter n=1 Tax=Diaporthe australafricana TaxID=127596 RepID=A0ABR3WEC7_9PEZI